MGHNLTPAVTAFADAIKGQEPLYAYAYFKEAFIDSNVLDGIDVTIIERNEVYRGPIRLVYSEFPHELPATIQCLRLAHKTSTGWRAIKTRLQFSIDFFVGRLVVEMGKVFLLDLNDEPQLIFHTDGEELDVSEIDA